MKHYEKLNYMYSKYVFKIKKRNIFLRIFYVSLYYKIILYIIIEINFLNSTNYQILLKI